MMRFNDFPNFEILVLSFFAVGPFQSEALLVPNHCVFDHIHKTKECKSFQVG